MNIVFTKISKYSRYSLWFTTVKFLPCCRRICRNFSFMLLHRTIFLVPRNTLTSLAFCYIQHILVMRSGIKENHLNLSETREACKILYVTFVSPFSTTLLFSWWKLQGTYFTHWTLLTVIASTSITGDKFLH